MHKNNSACSFENEMAALETLIAKLMAPAHRWCPPKYQDNIQWHQEQAKKLLWRDYWRWEPHLCWDKGCCCWCREAAILLKSSLDFTSFHWEWRSTNWTKQRPLASTLYLWSVFPLFASQPANKYLYWLVEDDWSAVLIKSQMFGRAKAWQTWWSDKKISYSWMPCSITKAELLLRHILPKSTTLKGATQPVKWSGTQIYIPCELLLYSQFWSLGSDPWVQCL